MHQPASDQNPVDSKNQVSPLWQAIADELLSQAYWQALLKRQLAAVSREAIREQPLPRLAEFAEILAKGAFEPRNLVAVTPVVTGTEIRPDDDVLAMDDTIPRGPELPDEEPLYGES